MSRHHPRHVAEARNFEAAVVLWLVLLGALVFFLLPGCMVRRTIEVTPTSDTPRACADGQPAKILQDPACPNGVCGYTCEPDRWKAPPP